LKKNLSSGSSTQGVDGAGVGDGVGKGVVGDGKVVVGDGVGKGVVGDGVGKGVSTILNISEPLRRSLEKVFLFGNNSFNSAVSVTLNHSATPFQNPSLKKKSSSEYHLSQSSYLIYEDRLTHHGNLGITIPGVIMNGPSRLKSDG
jgi:hypothetical protein